jgi:hypothetical protein
MTKAKNTETPETPDSPETPKHACLTDAWRSARAEMPAPKFDAVNPHYRSRYASLAELLRVAVPTLAKHKIGLTQRTAYEDGVTIIVTELLFWSEVIGEEKMIAEYPAIAKDSTNPQALGSAVTYARRYSLAALLAIAAEDDDDGNAATSGNGNGKPTSGSGYKADKGTAQPNHKAENNGTQQGEPWTLQRAKAKMEEAKAIPHLRNIEKKHGAAWKAALGEAELALLRAYHTKIERELSLEIPNKSSEVDLSPFDGQDPLNGQ